jgi:hypothetical protein
MRLVIDGIGAFDVTIACRHDLRIMSGNDYRTGRRISNQMLP